MTEDKREYGPSCQGAIFPNTFKKEGTQQPDWTGTVDVSKELLKALVDIAKERWERRSISNKMGVLDKVRNEVLGEG